MVEYDYFFNLRVLALSHKQSNNTRVCLRRGDSEPGHI